MDVFEAPGQQQVDRLAQHLGRRIAENLLGALVEERDTLLVIHRDDRVVGDVEDASQARLRRPQRLPGQLIGF